jgi:hypothetical protein
MNFEDLPAPPFQNCCLRPPPSRIISSFAPHSPHNKTKLKAKETCSILFDLMMTIKEEGTLKALRILVVYNQLNSVGILY